MYISTFYGVVRRQNGKFKAFYPVYANGDINPVVNGSEFTTFMSAVSECEAAYSALQSALSSNQDMSVYGTYNILYEHDYFHVNQVILELTSSSSGDPDYTNILTSINTNLTNLNTNIVNKNNQSDIVSCLQDIFMYTASDTNNKVSSMKCEDVSSHTENYLKTVNFLYQLRKLVNCFSNLDRDFNQPVDNNNKSINILYDKLSTTVSINNSNRSQSIADVLSRLAFVFTSSTDFAANNLINSSFIKKVSDKLANDNDLHTISQAIDLISTAIVQSDQSRELGAIKDSIDNLHLEQNNLIQVEGVLDYRLKPTDAE